MATPSMNTTRFAAATTAAAVVLTAGPALADSAVVQEQTFEAPISPTQFQLDFEPFDDQGGSRELVAVEITSDLTMAATVSAENDSDLPVDQWDAHLAGFATVDAGPLYAFALFEEGDASGPVAPTDGVPNSGPDFVDFGEMTSFASVGDVNDESFAAFQTDDAVVVTVFASGGATVGPISTDTTLIIDGERVQGTVQLTYHYVSTSIWGCDADIDGSGSVDMPDMIAVLANWGSCAGCAADIDGDDAVGLTDLLEVFSEWGSCPIE